MTGRDLTDVIREDVTRYFKECKALAEPDCRICHGAGQTTGYIGPMKTAVYPCPCTGRRL